MTGPPIAIVKASDLRCPDCGRSTWLVRVVTAPQPSIAVGVGQQIKGPCPTCGQVNPAESLDNR
jgi:predicted RNA-binding Zn-ribbon protein involved in translation (DUF1610 family)